jgi:hypothetical protein
MAEVRRRSHERCFPGGRRRSSGYAKHRIDVSSDYVSTDDPARSPSLVCIECGRIQTDDERGWRSYLTVDEDEPVAAIVYCLTAPSASSVPLLGVGERTSSHVVRRNV